MLLASRGRWLDDLTHDLRFAIRQIRRAPAFAMTAAVTLALGIGANTAIYSLINGFFKPLPVPDADRLVVLASVMPGDEVGFRYKLSFPAIEDYRQATAVFSDVFGFDIRISGLGVDGTTSQFVYQSVTGNFFSGLGIRAAAGRLLEPGEGEQLNAEPVVVLGHAYWTRRFGADPHVVGRTVRLDGLAGRIIGVAPEGFRGVFEGADMDGYVPLGVGRTATLRAGPRVWAMADIFSDRSIRSLTAVARLRPGVTIDQAQAAVDVLARGLAATYPATEKDTTLRVVAEQLARPLPLPFLSHLMPVVRGLLLATAALVLLIACMNVANLLLVRATVRQREMAVRAALGAGRQRLVRLLIVESLLLAVLGAALGLVMGKWLSVTFARSIYVGIDVPLHLDFTFDWRVFSYTLTTALATGLVVGVLPALRASRAEVTDLLHDGGRSGSESRGRQRIRSVLVVAQVAGSLVLLVVAGLLVRSLREAQQLDLGFDAAHVLTARLDTQHVGYDPARSARFYEALERRVQRLPGVESASMSFNLPLGYILGGYLVRPHGAAEATSEPRAAVGCNSVTPAYFDTMRIPILGGRGFTDRDVDGAPRVAIVNQTLAARFWPNEDPIGKYLDVPSIPGAAWQVVGIARDSKYIAIFESPLPHFYLPQAQNPSSLRALQIRANVSLADVATRLRHEITALDPDMPMADIRPLADTLSGNIGFVLFRVGALQAGAMGVLGLVLAVIGVYGVVSYRTMQRAREIGIRVALGAVPRDVHRLVIQQGATLVATGVAAGLLITLTLTQLLTRVLLRVTATDPLTFLAVIALLSTTAFVACYIPARRAIRVDPVTALRHE